MIEQQLGRCVASWYPGATGVAGAAKLSGGASKETWTFDIVHPDGNVGAILRRAPPGYAASPSPSRGVDLDGEAVLMQLAHDAGLPSPRVMHVLTPEDGLGRGFIMLEPERVAISPTSRGGNGLPSGSRIASSMPGSALPADRMLTFNAQDAEKRVKEGFLALLTQGPSSDEAIKVGRAAAGR